MPATTEKKSGMWVRHDNQPLGAFGRIALTLAAIFGVYFFYEGMDLGFTRGEITAYGLYCNTASGEMPCSDAETVRMRPVIYKVFVEQQLVLFTMEDGPPQRLHNCAVVSRADWKCEGPTAQTFGFKDGQYWTGYPGASSNARYVNRYQWLLSHDPPKPK